MSQTHAHPRVSLGLPVYNGARYLRAALESSVAQTFDDWELLICDNASTDGTAEICSEFVRRDRRIRYYRSATNRGAAPNYNWAFRLASGEYFKWADYDDVIAPQFLQECVRVLDRQPDVMVCYTRAHLIDETGAVVSEYDPLPDTSSERPHVRFGNLLLAQDHRLIQASGVLRSRAVRRTRLHESYPCSDEVLLAHLALLGRYHEIPDRLACIRVHAEQSTKGVLASERARVLFFDTSLEGRAVPIRWQYFCGGMRAIREAALPVWERVLCYGQMARWLARKQNLRSVVKDVLLMTNEVIPVFGRLYQEAVTAAELGAGRRPAAPAGGKHQSAG
jgi:glycosyltransferase involved in cell wall biosynthesis